MSQVLGSQLCRGEIQSAEDQVTFSFLFFFGCICGILKVPGKGSNLHHSSDPSHCSDNAGCLTSRATREFSSEGFWFHKGLSERARIRTESSKMQPVFFLRPFIAWKYDSTIFFNPARTGLWVWCGWRCIKAFWPSGHLAWTQFTHL